MKISEINAGQGDISIEGEIVSIEEPKEINKYGKILRVANAVVKDDSGEIKMTFWNDDIDRISEGKKIKLEKGYCSEFNDQKQLTAGKFGKFEIL